MDSSDAGSSIIAEISCNQDLQPVHTRAKKSVGQLAWQLRLTAPLPPQAAAVAAVDAAATSVAAAPARLKKLLEAKDKKACLLEMAGAGEIDQALIDLLDQARRVAGHAAHRAAGTGPGRQGSPSRCARLGLIAAHNVVH